MTDTQTERQVPAFGCRMLLDSARKVKFFTKQNQKSHVHDFLEPPTESTKARRRNETNLSSAKWLSPVRACAVIVGRYDGVWLRVITVLAPLRYYCQEFISMKQLRDSSIGKVVKCM